MNYQNKKNRKLLFTCNMTKSHNSSKAFISLISNLFASYIWLQPFNPLSLNSDQHQFSPKNIHMLPREIVTRVKKLITK